MASLMLNDREFGYPTHTLPDDSRSFLSGKKRHLDLLKSIGLPW